METTISISGMTCGHCVDAVTEELSALDGVEEVNVELNKGGISRAAISSRMPLKPAEISEAVAEAGYVVVSNGA
ncbi:Copper chaperone CopZ [Arthrobacter subterraneus]|uniref:Copper chaperone CopZ n=1 Tax=Arthrobacter subterraneus TaxID=335973 RepID=A0A1G8CM92_9MICC|nr:cation transporter [Arthrobacter subterraneus]AOY70835.1 heavy metal transporter [Arthrobacter sp. ZXY-2]SDH46598.1 Copper chaperone CopZ [Arthrobacter subterraneus]